MLTRSYYSVGIVFLLAELGSYTKSARESAFCVLYLVAGAGIEPASGGYEPPEILLLHPAILEFYDCTTFPHLGNSQLPLKIKSAKVIALRS